MEGRSFSTVLTWTHYLIWSCSVSCRDSPNKIVSRDSAAVTVLVVFPLHLGVAVSGGVRGLGFLVFLTQHMAEKLLWFGLASRRLMVSTGRENKATLSCMSYYYGQSIPFMLLLVVLIRGALGCCRKSGHGRDAKVEI